MSDLEQKNNNQQSKEEPPQKDGFSSSLKGPGGRIGRFRIERELGRGAVGAVYLAHDTKLDRPVAIKSLPAEVMGDPKAKLRFTREARVLASLNHPNIAAIYEELEEAEGIGYLVLEYVPGQTLAERIAKSNLELEEALTIALQIAEAVAAAHELGIIHRDLKPGNIKITPEGKVKVLDFGLAKSVGGEPRPSKRTKGRGETLYDQSTITEPGLVIGTPAYMSPEQARGKQADKRSDIWSLGCVLYEMLSGRQPFEGQTVSDMLANVLQADPDWQALPQTTPTNIVVLLRRCLEKDPRRRLHDIADAAIEINETINLPAIVPPTTTTSFEIAHPTGWKKLIAVGAVCLLLGIIMGAIAICSRWRPGAPKTQPIRSFVICPETSFEVEALWHHALAFSPDGKRLAYVEQGSDGRRKIYIREMDEFKAKPLSGTEGAISPFFSPDGQWLGYVDHFQRKLKKIAIKGGEPIILGDSVHFRGGSWGTDDNIIFTPAAGTATGGGLWRIWASGEGLEELTVPDQSRGESGHIWPQILPGGKLVLFTNVHAGGLENQFEVYSLETGKRHFIFKGGTYARYISTGHIVYAHNKTLYAVPFDIERLEVVGSAVPVVSDVMTPESRSAQFAISNDGSLAYIPVVTRSTELRPVWVDRQGQAYPLPAATPRNYGNARISPDGRQAAFDIRDGRNSDIWIYDLMRHTLNPLTSDGSSGFAVWAPDGESVLFWSYRTGKPRLFGQSMAGGEPELFATLEELVGMPVACSPDGKELLIVWSDPKHPRWDDDMYLVSLDRQSEGLPTENEKSRPRPFIQRNHNQRHGVWSPDGRWVAYASDESGRWEVYVEPYPGPGPKTMISTDGGYQPLWSRNGKELFYRCGYKMIAGTIETKPEFRVTRYEVLFEAPYLCQVNRVDYDVAPDGRFLMIQAPQEPAPVSVNVVLNWFEELKRLVPVEKIQ
ncbi:MAG: protein kinase [Sedimentisphaerales bacterium]